MEHPWVMMYTVTCGIRLDALAIKPISSNSIATTCIQVLRFFSWKKS